MFKLCTNNKSVVKKHIKNKMLDAVAFSNNNLIDDIILSMCHAGIINCLNAGFNDKRKKNSFIPSHLIMILAIAAKMKVKTSLTDIPYAINDHRTLAELGYNAINDNSGDGWFTEGTLRYLIGKYKSDDLFNYYNQTIQNYIFPLMNILPDIHILDCTKIAVNKDNSNYENASWSLNHKGDKMFGYKLSSLRCLYEDTGIIEDVRFGTASTNDLELSKDILYNSPCLHEGDCILMDRGFFSREMICYLKYVRKVDVYIPLKKNLAEYTLAVAWAEETNDWKPHPTRRKQMICHVPNVDCSIQIYPTPKYNICFNTCVVWYEETQTYSVFATTDTSKSAEEIIVMYEMRTEIEEDFRQLKDFWKLEDFKSTKYNMISFHLICVLFGYLFYQLYLNTEDGQKYIGKCLPVILKNYKAEFLNYLVLYSGEYFCIMTMKEFMEFFDQCEKDVKEYILKFI